MMPSTAIFDYSRPSNFAQKQGSHYTQDIWKKKSGFSLNSFNFRGHTIHEVNFYTSIYGVFWGIGRCFNIGHNNLNLKPRDVVKWGPCLIHGFSYLIRPMYEIVNDADNLDTAKEKLNILNIKMERNYMWRLLKSTRINLLKNYSFVSFYIRYFLKIKLKEKNNKKFYFPLNNCHLKSCLLEFKHQKHALFIFIKEPSQSPMGWQN